MRANHFAGFNKFMEQGPGEDPMAGTPTQPQPPPQKPNVKDPYMSTVKTVTNIPKAEWGKSSVFPISQTWLGTEFIGQPQSFRVANKEDGYPDAFNDKTVTIIKVVDPMTAGPDKDNEIVQTMGVDKGRPKTYTIPRSYFDKLIKPKNYTGADFQTASGTAMQPK